MFASTHRVFSVFQGMFAYAVKHHAKKADMELVNGQNLTPLTLASKLGRNEIFKEIIELQSFVSTGTFGKPIYLAPYSPAICIIQTCLMALTFGATIETNDCIKYQHPNDLN